MYYVIEKYGTFLSAFSDISQTWYHSEANAIKFWSKDHAKSVAEECDGHIMPRIMPV